MQIEAFKKEDFKTYLESLDQNKPKFYAAHATQCPIARWLNSIGYHGIKVLGRIVEQASPFDPLLVLPAWVGAYVRYVDKHHSKNPDAMFPPSTPITPTQALEALSHIEGED